jgi:hypothetical protein
MTALQIFDGEADPASASRGRSVGRWSACFGCTLVLGMSVGTLGRPLGSLGETRVSDWIDLLTPFAVLGCGAMVLSVAGAGRGPRLVCSGGGVAFAMGHGLHVGANSISNVDDTVVAEAAIVHLWDEVVSHYISCSGLYLVLVAVAWALHAHPLRLRVAGGVVAVAVTVSLVTTYIEGDVAWLGLALLASGVAAGLRWERSLGTRLAMFIGGSGLLMLAAWGLYWYATDGTIFPEFSDVGWI